jgi:hypothetical protein
MLTLRSALTALRAMPRPAHWLMLLALLVLPLSACHDNMTLQEPPRPQPVRAVAVSPTPPTAPTPRAEAQTQTQAPVVIGAPSGSTPSGAPIIAPAGAAAPSSSAPQGETPLMAQQRRGCEAEGGVLRPRPGGLLACVRVTGDSGRACTASSQCQSECLARSGTCAPVTPLFGCHEVLLAPGNRVTQCVD